MILLAVLLGSVISSLLVFSAVTVVHRSSLFGPLLTIMEARGGFFSEMISCRDCLSMWVAAWAALVVLIFMPVQGALQDVSCWMILWLASSALFQFLPKEKNSDG